MLIQQFSAKWGTYLVCKGVVDWFLGQEIWGTPRALAYFYNLKVCFQFILIIASNLSASVYRTLLLADAVRMACRPASWLRYWLVNEGVPSGKEVSGCGWTGQSELMRECKGTTASAQLSTKTIKAEVSLKKRFSFTSCQNSSMKCKTIPL